MTVYRNGATTAISPLRIAATMQCWPTSTATLAPTKDRRLADDGQVQLSKNESPTLRQRDSAGRGSHDDERGNA